MTALKSLAELANWSFDDIIDVRSPSEFAEDHIPGAVNYHALSDEERAVVGTIYVQDSAFKAKRIGATMVARNAADHIEQHMSAKDGAWQPLVYCWRGGQRSNSFASILRQIGWRTEVLEGGYKSYRRLVVQALYKQPVDLRIILIDGNTGTAKTEILDHLQQANAQVIDLEAMAAHRGSLFGAVARVQPSQKAFESRLALAIAKLDPTQPVFVEAESNKIGEILIPTAFWKAMIKAPRITIKAPLSARADFLIRSYADLLEDQEQLIDRITKLKDYHSNDQISEWCGLVEKGDYVGLAGDLMERHYDPRYAKTFARRERVELGQVDLASLDETALETVAIPQILTLAKQTD